MSQHDWYRRKGADAARRAGRWSVALLVGEVVCFGIACFLFGKDRPMDVAGIAAALVGGGATWIAVKQYEQLASAYRVAAQELGEAQVMLEAADDWVAAVADAEETISREHTLWRARRS